MKTSLSHGRITFKRVLSHMNESPTNNSHMNVSCHIWTNHIWEKITHNESCRVWMSHIWMRSNINESCHIWTSHVWTSHTYKWVMSTITRSITHKKKLKPSRILVVIVLSAMQEPPHNRKRAPYIRKRVLLICKRALWNDTSASSWSCSMQYKSSSALVCSI